MIFDLLRDQPGPEDVADVCVVGAGAAGICLAVELVRRGKSVLLLEGGGPEIEAAAQEPYTSEVVGLGHRGVHEGRFRAAGGTTTKWGGQILELDEGDFARREWVPGSGWPFAKGELTRHYARALELEGVAGAMREDSAVWRALGLEVPAFEGLESYLSRWCPEPNFARLHAVVLGGPAVRVWLHANAVGLRMEGDAVRGVQCRTQAAAGAESREVEFQAREFVFCLGSIESVRFFLQPRVGGLPWDGSGLLGRHFQDHIDVNVAEIRPLDRRRFGQIFDNIFVRGYKYHPKLRLGASVQSQERTLNCAGTMTFESEAENAAAGLKGTAKHLLRGRFGEVSATDVAGMVRHAPLLLRQSWRYARWKRAYNPPQARVQLRVHCEQRPDAASSITLGSERDSLGLLRTRLDWHVSELELKTVRTYARVAAEALGGFAEVSVDGAVLEGGEALVARCDDSNHHMGGMRMGASAAEGLVSPDLLLYGTANCYVCSGAVFPTSGFSNPTHTVIALAVRLAERLGG